MKASPEIHILTGSIHSGKSSFLLRKLNDRQNIAGFICPDENESRMLLDLKSGKKYQFQIEKPENPDDVSIGKYCFSGDTFKKAGEILNDIKYDFTGTLIIDEIGKLELNGNGLEPALSKCLERLRNSNAQIILVVRDYLLDEVLRKYDLQSPTIQTTQNFTTEFRKRKPLKNGIILAGGRSTRMFEDKSKLVYHGKLQYLFLQEILSDYCEHVYISCNKDNVLSEECIVDLPEYSDSGPAGGILSAFKQLNSPLLVCGIDYPFFDQKELENLIAERDDTALASVMYNKETGYFEPMIGIYEKGFLELLKKEFDKGNDSVQYLLRSTNVKKVKPLKLESIKSVDTPEEYLKVKKSLNENS